MRNIPYLVVSQTFTVQNKRLPDGQFLNITFLYWWISDSQLRQDTLSTLCADVKCFISTSVTDSCVTGVL